MKKTYVSTGSFKVGASAPVILDAMLGSCVGVVLYDRPNAIGGLHHILLPEPVHMDLTPERYATTGLPLFYDALCRKGAHPANIKARIAGGALVGNLSAQDLDLDIGGRTCEHVMKFMQKTQIPVEQSQTGGLWGYRLQFNMQRFEVQIRAGDWLAPDRSQRCRAVEFGELARILDQLEPIPQIALQILRDYQDQQYALADMAQDLKKDQVLSAHTLKLANSALYQRQRKIGTIEDAVFLLGQDMIIKWVVSAAVQRLFQNTQGGYSLCRGGLYHHARKTAILCEQIAEMTGTVKPALAYLAGLLHDIGKVVLDQYIHNVMPSFYRGLSEGKVDFLGAEREILGMDHTEAGRLLARKWNFARPFAEAISYHHQPDDDRIRNQPLPSIVYVADVLLSRFLPGVTAGFPGSNQLAEQMHKINLTSGQVHRIINTIADGEFHLAA